MRNVVNVFCIVFIILVGTAGIAKAAVAPLTANAVKTWQPISKNNKDSAIVWDIEQIGSKVYVVGSFDKVLSPDGKTTIIRDNVLVLDAATRNPLPEQYTFNASKQYSTTPDPNCKITNWNVTNKEFICDTVYSVKVGSNDRVYFGGAFTSVNGQSHSRIAQVYNGSLTSFKTPAINGWVRSLAYNGTLFAGGQFIPAGGNIARTRLAAFNASTGALLPWKASANARVLSIIVSPNKLRLIVGGDFTHLNNTYMPRIGAVNVATGDSFAQWIFKWNSTNYETKSRVTSFAADSSYIYFGSEGDGNGFDGRKKIDSNGKTIWTDTCGGATWAVDVDNTWEYSGSHAHSCGQTPGGFPETAHLSTCVPAGTCRWQRVLVQNKVTREIQHFFPDFNGGEYGPSDRYPSRLGPRAVEMVSYGPTKYLLVGGQSTVVNGQSQKGLVAFGTTGKSYVPKKPPTPLVGRVGNKIYVTIRTTEDLDDRSLKYMTYRNGNWISTGYMSSGPGLSSKYLKIDPVAGGTYYTTVTDSRGNIVKSDSAKI